MKQTLNQLAHLNDDHDGKGTEQHGIDDFFAKLNDWVEISNSPSLEKTRKLNDLAHSPY